MQLIDLIAQKDVVDQAGNVLARQGQYNIYNKEGLTTAKPAGAVLVLTYSHGGAGEASTLPVKTAAGQPDGSAGLGSEQDAVLGTDGQNHPFSSTPVPGEAQFPVIKLFGFVFTYGDGSAFYSGTVADDGTLTAGTRQTALGTYQLFSEGVTLRNPGTVVITFRRTLLVRARHRTVSPRSTSLRTTRLPTNPVPPVTSTGMENLHHGDTERTPEDLAADERG